MVSSHLIWVETEQKSDVFSSFLKRLRTETDRDIGAVAMGIYLQSLSKISKGVNSGILSLKSGKSPFMITKGCNSTHDK